MAKSRKSSGMTDKQQRFVEEYLVDLCAKQAATRAGYSPKTAEQQGYQLLQLPAVAAAIAAGREAQSRRTGITADVILGELLRLARCDIGQAFDADGNMLPLKDMPEDVRRAISAIDVQVDEHMVLIGQEDEVVEPAKTVTTKLRFWDKKGALELLGKHLKLFTDKLEVTGLDDMAQKLAAARARAKAKP